MTAFFVPKKSRAIARLLFADDAGTVGAQAAPTQKVPTGGCNSLLDNSNCP